MKDTQRYEMRRATKLPIEVISAHWDEPISFETGDLSAAGAYVESKFLLDPGEEVVVSFVVPGESRPFLLFGRVARVSRGQRRRDRHCGYGVRFLDATPLERITIRQALRGTPPPIPCERLAS